MPQKIVFKDLDEVIEFIKKNEQIKPWVSKAREYSVRLRALVDGKGFHEELIEQIEKIESTKRAAVRKKYSKDIRSLFKRLTNTRSNVFQANGGSVELNIKTEPLKDSITDALTDFKGQKSIHQYLAENLFQLADIDPSGLIYIEYKSDNGEIVDIYPTYKSIQDIRGYKAYGQQVKAVIFEPKPIPNGVVWRVVDSEKEWFVNQFGQSYEEDTEKSFNHPFGDVPAIVLGEREEIGEKYRLSWLDKILPDAEMYALKTSVKTIYEIQKGFPLHWRMKMKHRDESGVRRTGQGVDASKDLKGVVDSNDVSDVINVPAPREGDPAIKDYAGYISPDIDYLDYSTKSIQEKEESMATTLWGTTKEKGQKGKETATGRYIDLQPVHNELNNLTNIAEYVQNTLANFVVKAFDRTNNKDNKYIYVAGRRFLIESVDTVLERYDTSRKDGLPSAILDKLLEEWVLTKYKTDPSMQDQMIKKIRIEPYVHWDALAVNSMFGANESYKKVLFNDWWKKEADYSKEYEQLQNDFNLKLTQNGYSSSRLVSTGEQTTGQVSNEGN